MEWFLRGFWRRFWIILQGNLAFFGVLCLMIVGLYDGSASELEAWLLFGGSMLIGSVIGAFLTRHEDAEIYGK